MLPRALLACVSLCGALFAQTTWIVDRNGGPGVNFTNIQAAVDAASAGDLILVRPGSYAPFSVSKGVKILGLPAFDVAGPALSSVVEILDIPANETLVLANATISGLFFLVPPPYVSVQNTSGHVHLQNIQFTPDVPTTLQRPIGLSVSSSADVTVSDCTFPQTIIPTAVLIGPLPVVVNAPAGFSPAVSASQSDVTFVGSTLFGRNGAVFGGGLSSLVVLDGAGLVATDSTVHLSRCDLLGGNPISGPQPAIIATRSALMITGLATNFVHAGPLSSFASPAVSADSGSTVAIDTQLSLQGSGGSPPLAGGATFVQRRIVTLDASGGTLGSTLTIDAVSAQDDICILLLGLPYPPTPSPIGTLRINLATAVLLAQQVVPAPGVTQATINLPNAVVLRGLLLGFQAANWDHTTGNFEVSNVANLVLQ